MQQAKKVSYMFKKRNECEPHGNLSVDLNKFFSIVGFFLFCSVSLWLLQNLCL